MVRIFDLVDGKLDTRIAKCAKDVRRCTYIPSKHILGVQMYTDVDQRIDFSKCECVDITDEKRAFIASLPYPHYVVRVKNEFGERTDFSSITKKYTAPDTCDYLLDSSEHEHMERFLAGTDDALHDFVHELRYNPRALPPSTDLAEAKERFNKRPRK